jgi:hypothetical protein
VGGGCFARERTPTVSVETRGVALSSACIIGPIWFVALVIIQGILHPDYSHIAMPVSARAAWPAGWIQRLKPALQLEDRAGEAGGAAQTIV